jgi:hypothetical protein
MLNTNGSGGFTMSLTIPPGYGLAAFVFTSSEGTEPFVTTLGVGMSEWGGDYVSCANFLFDAWATTILDQQDSDMTLSKVQLTIGSDGPTGSVDSTNAAEPGTRSVEGAPWAMSIIARKNTSTVGRAYRGRMFIPGALASGDTAQGGAVSSTRVTAVQTALTAFRLELNDPTIVGGLVTPPVLLHSAGEIAPSPIVGFTVSPLVGWIRKRIR